MSSVAWALFAAALWLLLRTVLVKVLASGSVLVFALLRPVTSWDFAILSESLSISLGVIVVSCFLLWVRTGSRLALVGMSLVGVWWTFTRPDIRIMLAFVCLGLLWFAWRDRARRRQALASLAVRVPAATELGRIGVQESLLFRLCVLMLLAAAVDAALGRVQDRRARTLPAAGGHSEPTVAGSGEQSSLEDPAPVASVTDVRAQNI